MAGPYGGARNQTRPRPLPKPTPRGRSHSGGGRRRQRLRVLPQPQPAASASGPHPCAMARRGLPSRAQGRGDRRDQPSQYVRAVRRHQKRCWPIPAGRRRDHANGRGSGAATQGLFRPLMNLPSRRLEPFAAQHPDRAAAAAYGCFPGDAPDQPAGTQQDAGRFLGNWPP